ncbi:hypothetical protein D3C83_296300 [compost metagenome]
MVEQLQAIGEMSLPDRIEAGGGHEVLPLVLLGKQRGEALEARQACFVGPFGAELPRFGLARDHAARRRA